MENYSGVTRKASVLQDQLKGSFATMPQDTKDLIVEIMSQYHIRDSFIHPDGSQGSMQISPMQMNDALAYLVSTVVFDLTKFDEALAHRGKRIG